MERGLLLLFPCSGLGTPDSITCLIISHRAYWQGQDAWPTCVCICNSCSGKAGTAVGAQLQGRSSAWFHGGVKEVVWCLGTEAVQPREDWEKSFRTPPTQLSNESHSLSFWRQVRSRGSLCPLWDKREHVGKMAWEFYQVLHLLWKGPTVNNKPCTLLLSGRELLCV
jgi:hypothetical protein